MIKKWKTLAVWSTLRGMGGQITKKQGQIPLPRQIVSCRCVHLSFIMASSQRQQNVTTKMISSFPYHRRHYSKRDEADEASFTA